jgi:hypothetical protein
MVLSHVETRLKLTFRNWTARTGLLGAAKQTRIERRQKEGTETIEGLIPSIDLAPGRF